MDTADVVEDFNGVYVLFSLNDDHFGKTYIGFTVNPNRRIRQHNRGKDAGGAKKTSKRGPWRMILIVHGFPNKISALQFEWAWQNPERSRRLRHVEHKKRMGRKETMFQYNVRILAEMLRVGPWKRLPLTIRWLETDHQEDFPPHKMPPFHMPICYGPVKSKKIARSPAKGQSSQSTSTFQPDLRCHICFEELKNSDKSLKCLNAECDLIGHMICLADLFLEEGEYLPVEGDCPKCDARLLWGDLIRKMKGCSVLVCSNGSNSENENVNNAIEEEDSPSLESDSES